MHLLVRVAEIKGRCPVYKVGDSFRLEDGYRLVSEIPLCMHSLAALLPHYNALRISEPEGVGLGWKRKQDKSVCSMIQTESYAA
ncbi:MAG: hypothetical protein ABIK98_08330 [Pseudomonadota bacterium]|nr:hypothetical protein [Pseudomonadota bacterium]